LLPKNRQTFYSATRKKPGEGKQPVPVCEGEFNGGNERSAMSSGTMKREREPMTHNCQELDDGARRMQLGILRILRERGSRAKRNSRPTKKGGM